MSGRRNQSTTKRPEETDDQTETTPPTPSEPMTPDEAVARTDDIPNLSDMTFKQVADLDPVTAVLVANANIPRVCDKGGVDAILKRLNVAKEDARRICPSCGRVGLVNAKVGAPDQNLFQRFYRCSDGECGKTWKGIYDRNKKGGA